MIKMVGYRILIKHDDSIKMSEGGIVLAQNENLAEANVNSGYIVDMGEDCFVDYPDPENKPKVGDYVAYSRHSGHYYVDPFQKEKFTMVNDKDVLAVVTKGVQKYDRKHVGRRDYDLLV